MSQLTMLTMRSPVGELRLLGDAHALTGVYLPVQAAPAATPGTTPPLARAAAQLAAYFAGELVAFDVPLAPIGTPFQTQVWSALRAIPYGEVVSYGAIASALGRPSASRAVGFANSKNPISIIVPCHRVVGARGALTGYAGGMTAKAWLLAHERGAVAGTVSERC